MQPDEQTLARLKPGCICMGIRLQTILEAINNGATSFDEIASRTGIGRGDCKGRRCRMKVENLLARRTTNITQNGNDGSSP